MPEYEEMPFETAPELVPEMCRGLGFEEGSDVYVKAMVFSEKMFTEPGVDRSPRVMAASCVYFSSLMVNDKVTQKEVARVADVNFKSIMEGYKDVAEAHDVRVGKSGDNNETETGPLNRIIGRMKGGVT